MVRRRWKEPSPSAVQTQVLTGRGGLSGGSFTLGCVGEQVHILLSNIKVSSWQWIQGNMVSGYKENIQIREMQIHKNAQNRKKNKGTSSMEMQIRDGVFNGMVKGSIVSGYKEMEHSFWEKNHPGRITRSKQILMMKGTHINSSNHSFNK
jgi:hypothetical protein